MSLLERIPPDTDDLPGQPAPAPDAPTTTGPGHGISTLDRIRARYAAIHAEPDHVDLPVPGQPLLGVRYRTREPAGEPGQPGYEPGTAQRLRDNDNGIQGDLELLLDHCESLLVRDDESAEWQPLRQHGMPVGFEFAAAELLGLDVDPKDGTAMDVLLAVFDTAPIAEGPASVHVVRFLSWVGSSPVVDEDALMGESSPSRP